MGSGTASPLKQFLSFSTRAAVLFSKLINGFSIVVGEVLPAQSIEIMFERRTRVACAVN
jgi:hypothetical protein